MGLVKLCKQAIRLKTHGKSDLSALVAISKIEIGIKQGLFKKKEVKQVLLDELASIEPKTYLER